MAQKATYTEAEIRSLDWREHIRLRPGMYIGRLGDGDAPDDGIYVLLKEIVDNAVDEFVMGAGRRIELRVDERSARVRDYGRGIPLGKVVECVSRINTGGKYGGEAFKKSVGLNGVGTKAVNALSAEFWVRSVRDGRAKVARFRRGELLEEREEAAPEERDGTEVFFTPDPEIFGPFHFRTDIVTEMVRTYACLNRGLTLVLNGERFRSEAGLLDLVRHRLRHQTLRYEPIHLEGEDIEVVLAHGDHVGEVHFSFVNGQHTVQGGTHLSALREAVVKAVRDFYGQNFEAGDVRQGLVAAISVRLEEPVFESQTKTKLGSTELRPGGPSLRAWIGEFVRRELDNFLHRHPDTAEALHARILQSERERKEIAGVKKLARERARRAAIFNKKLRDCRIHLTSEHPRRRESTLFICEGDSASGSITKARDVETQAVFSLRGKPLNTYGMSKKIVYQNEEFNLLQHALDIEDGLERLRYNRVVIATDADVDGMHIRLLLVTFFLQFYPELIERGHLFILQTPLFRVRNKEITRYCYDETEKRAALAELGKGAEVTRFKGLGEISPDEFKAFIGPQMRLDPVVITDEEPLPQLLRYYMGKNTPQRRDFIIENLRVETTAPAEVEHG